MRAARARARVHARSWPAPPRGDNQVTCEAALESIRQCAAAHFTYLSPLMHSGNTAPACPARAGPRRAVALSRGREAAPGLGLGQRKGEWRHLPRRQHLARGKHGGRGFGRVAEGGGHEAGEPQREHAW
eukprot:scaffold2377_cov74-Phaeocystis_antarctica.AAC.8